MPEAHDTLAIFAEVSIALVGFSGIVIALGKGSLGSLTALEARRLSNLFTLSGLALVLSLLGASLLHTNLYKTDLLWKLASAVVFLIGAPWLIRDMVRVYRLEDSEKAQVNRLLIFTFNTMAISMFLLQLANSMIIKEPWPFFIALVLIITGALQQFVLLVRSGLSDDQ